MLYPAPSSPHHNTHTQLYSFHVGLIFLNFQTFIFFATISSRQFFSKSNQNQKNTKQIDKGTMTPFIAFERLFFAVFGQTTNADINPMPELRPEWTEPAFKIIFGSYLLVSVIVLINLLIAMMSDTYQRYGYLSISTEMNRTKCLLSSHVITFLFPPFNFSHFCVYTKEFRWFKNLNQNEKSNVFLLIKRNICSFYSSFLR